MTTCMRDGRVDAGFFAAAVRSFAQRVPLVQRLGNWGLERHHRRPGSELGRNAQGSVLQVRDDKNKRKRVLLGMQALATRKTRNN